MPKFRTATDDAMARESVETMVSEILADNNEDITDDRAREIAKLIVGVFPFAEAETTVSKVAGGSTVPLRRYALTTAWEVDLIA